MSKFWSHKILGQLVAKKEVSFRYNGADEKISGFWTSSDQWSNFSPALRWSFRFTLETPFLPKITPCVCKACISSSWQGKQINHDSSCRLKSERPCEKDHQSQRFPHPKNVVLAETSGLWHLHGPRKLSSSHQSFGVDIAIESWSTEIHKQFNLLLPNTKPIFDNLMINRHKGNMFYSESSSTWKKPPNAKRKQNCFNRVAMDGKLHRHSPNHICQERIRRADEDKDQESFT